MTRPLPSDLEVARLLLAHEPPAGPSANERAAAAARVYEKLFERLSPVIGVSGMRAVLARSARLVTPEHPCFEAASVASDRASEQLLACLLELEAGAMTEAAAALYGTLLGLLNSFIGERLVWQVLRSAFPGIEESKAEVRES